MIAIIDYGMGNLRSVQKALEYNGFEAIITNDKNVINNSDKLILPGVGAFKDAINNFKKAELTDIIKEQSKKGKYLLGICLGMQLLFTKSFEDGEFSGLNLIKGDIKKFENINLKVPQIGWNDIEIIKPHKLFENLEKKQAYFVHSYYAEIIPETATITEYGVKFASSVIKDNIFGMQFHPEKSGETGLKILKNFGDLK